MLCRNNMGDPSFRLSFRFIVSDEVFFAPPDPCRRLLAVAFFLRGQIPSAPAKDQSRIERSRRRQAGPPVSTDPARCRARFRRSRANRATSPGAVTKRRLGGSSSPDELRMLGEIPPDRDDRAHRRISPRGLSTPSCWSKRQYTRHANLEKYENPPAIRRPTPTLARISTPTSRRMALPP